MFTENIIDNGIGYPEFEVLVPVGISICCAKCNEGYLDYVGEDATDPINSCIMPRKYEHRCTNERCDNHVFLDSFYPAVEYKSMNSFIESEGYK